MAVSQFEAKTFGVGELITQRKLFRVPPHQRSYAWDKESVDAFLQDIETAISNGASDYFIGLIVIQASEIGEWILLDGQQRLTTVSLVFAGLRHWLLQHGLEADATQIHNEYLGVRRLGGTSSSRMLLNTENQAYFQRAALNLFRMNDSSWTATIQNWLARTNCCFRQPFVADRGCEILREATLME